MLAKKVNLISNPDLQADVVQLYENIMAISRRQQRRQGQGQAQSLGETGAVVPFSAAYVQKLPGGPVFPGRLNEGLQNGGIGAGVQKGPPGQDLLPGVPRVLGVLLLDRQQVHIPLPGNVKAVVTGANQGPLPFCQGCPADGTKQIHKPSLLFSLISYPIFGWESMP